ncbi:MAG: DNA-processing protein DprA [Burkholderiales bacterium]
MSEPREFEAWLRLGLVPGLGPVGQRRLLDQFGHPESVVAASSQQLEHVVGRKTAAAIVAGPDAERLKAAQDWLLQPGNRLLTLADSDYPAWLLQTIDPPPLLYLKGDHSLLSGDSLAIVGSRNATPQGAANAEAFACELSDAGLHVVSGLALGIDAAAHRGGLAGASSSIAVVGTGLDIVYPARNRDLAHALAERGLLISEFPLGTKAIASNFPRRNRLISGLALGVLVIEAALQSGSLITARFALEQGRDVFALPGSIHSPLSKGCHLLIKQGAKLVESASDVLEELRGVQNGRASNPVLETPHDQNPLLSNMGFDPVDLDTLCSRSGLTADGASAMLLQLELDGVVARLPGGRFQRLR